MGNTNCCFMIIAVEFFFFRQSPRGTCIITTDQGPHKIEVSCTKNSLPLTARFCILRQYLSRGQPLSQALIGKTHAQKTNLMSDNTASALAIKQPCRWFKISKLLVVYSVFRNSVRNYICTRMALGYVLRRFTPMIMPRPCLFRTSTVEHGQKISKS